MSCPEAWAFLYRLTKDGEKKNVPQEIIDSWRAGGQARNRLLTDFVRRVYNKECDHATNSGRLECFIKLRQASRNWKTNLQGFEWLTEEEMRERKWSEKLIYNSACIFVVVCD